MRLSIVLFFCFVLAVVNAATLRTTIRRAMNGTMRGTTKAPVPKSAYAYLRTIRTKNSCAGGSCPFWERHGRSFAALRCYSQQYQECTCLHRMCFSSCMFSREVCNQEMVSCLQQICPRCMPASASAMCAVYDSMAERVADALSVFACYPCCPNINGGANSTTGSGSTTVVPPAGGESSTTAPFSEYDITDPAATTEIDEYYEQYPEEEGSEILPGTGENNHENGNGNGNGNGYTNGNGNGNGNGNSNVAGAPNGNGNGNANAVNCNAGNNYPGVVFPGSDAMFYNNNFPNRNQQAVKQRGRQTLRTTKRAVATTRRTPVTTRRTAQAASTARVVRKPVQAQKKPQM